MVKQITTTDRGRFYEHEGVKYWSVTTLLKQGIPKEALIQWSGNEAAKYAVDALKAVAERTLALLQDVLTGETDATDDRLPLAVGTYKDPSGLIGQLASGDPKTLELAYDDIRKASVRTRDSAGTVGTKAHKIIEKYILEKGMGDIPANDDPKVVQILDRFMEFEREFEPEWESAEMTVLNTAEGYAGKMDFLAHIPKLGDGLTLGDFKTGRGVFPETALQLAAYRHADIAQSAFGNVIVDMPKTERAIVVHLRPDDENSYQNRHPKSYYEVIPMDTGDEVFQMFKYVMQIAWFTREGDNWQGDPVKIGE